MRVKINSIEELEESNRKVVATEEGLKEIEKYLDVNNIEE